MLYFHSWSGGKDSTASIILDHIHGLPPSKIVFSEVMYDNKKGISGELPEHIDWIKNIAIPRFEKWGYEVEILRSEYDYVSLFHRYITKSKLPERNGRLWAFPLGGMCYVNRDLKVAPIRRFLNGYRRDHIPYLQYVGIAADELVRLKRLENCNDKLSLLLRFNYTERMAYDLCHEFDLLSPIYQNSHRGGCWFCPNASIKEFSYIKLNYPEMWAELAKLSKTSNMVSQGFKYGKTFAQVDREIDDYLEDQAWAKAQMTIFDFCFCAN